MSQKNYGFRPKKNRAPIWEKWAILATSIFAVMVYGSAILSGEKSNLPENISTKTLESSDFTPDSIWHQVYNPDGKIWGYYGGENIAHTSTNWLAYQTEVNLKNPKGLEGNILLPDLDGKNGIRKADPNLF